MTNFQTFTILKTLSHIVKNLPKAATVAGKLERKQLLSALTQATRQASAPDPVGVTTPAAGDDKPAGPAAPPVLAIHEAPLPSSMPTVRPGTVAGAPVLAHAVDIEVAE